MSGSGCKFQLGTKVRFKLGKKVDSWKDQGKHTFDKYPEFVREGCSSNFTLPKIPTQWLYNKFLPALFLRHLFDGKYSVATLFYSFIPEFALNLKGIMFQNGQTYFKNPPAFPKIFLSKCVWPFRRIMHCKINNNSQQFIAQFLVNFFEKFKFRSSRRRYSVRKRVLKNFAKFTGKHLCQSLFFNKVAGLGPGACNVIKKEILAQVFSCDLCEISKNTFFTELLWGTASVN